MTKIVLEGISERVHMIKEASRDKKGRRVFATKCGAEVGQDEGLVTGWDSDITCPDCAVPWV